MTQHVPLEHHHQIRNSQAARWSSFQWQDICITWDFMFPSSILFHENY